MRSKCRSSGLYIVLDFRLNFVNGSRFNMVTCWLICDMDTSYFDSQYIGHVSMFLYGMLFWNYNSYQQYCVCEDNNMENF